MALEGSQRQRRGQIYVALAAVAWSTAGVLQRQLTLDTSTQVLGRAVFAGAALLGFVAIVERGRVLQAFRSVGVAGIAVALCVATASGSFIAALNHTSVARVLFILAVSPVLAALLARLTLGEPVTRRTVLAMALALAGVAVMLGAPGEGSLAGDGLAFVAALAFAVMIVITRWRRDVSMAPATCLSQAILVAAFLPFADPGEIGGDDVGWLAALGIGQIGLGFGLLTVGARLIPAAQVGLITLLEVVLGPLWVWLALDERPSTLTLVGGAIVIVAIVIQTRAAPLRTQRRPGAASTALAGARVGSPPARPCRVVIPVETPSARRPYVDDGLWTHGDRVSARVAQQSEAVLTAAANLVQFVDHRLQLAFDIRGVPVDEGDGAGGHAATVSGGEPNRRLGVGPVTRVAFAAGRWIGVTVASVLVLERLTDLAAQSVAGNGPLGSRTLGSDRPHGLDAPAEVLGIHAQAPSAQPARVRSGCEPVTDTRRIG